MLLSGCAPFDTSDAQLEERQVCMGSWSFEHANWQAVSAEAKATVDSMLQVDVSRRASAAMVLRSAWVRRHGRRVRVPSMGPGTKLSSPPGEKAAACDGGRWHLACSVDQGTELAAAPNDRCHVVCRRVDVQTRTRAAATPAGSPGAAVGAEVHRSYRLA